jgi:dihydroorotate dehydrogenase (NAD+) catalytic subunit
MVHRVYTQVAKKAGVPIIGLGGIQYARDAIEFLLAGATGLAVGTALFVNPLCIVEIRDGIADYLHRHGFTCISEIVGALRSD